MRYGTVDSDYEGPAPHAGSRRNMINQKAPISVDIQPHRSFAARPDCPPGSESPVPPPEKGALKATRATAAGCGQPPSGARPRLRRLAHRAAGCAAPARGDLLALPAITFHERQGAGVGSRRGSRALPDPHKLVRARPGPDPSRPPGPSGPRHHVRQAGRGGRRLTTAARPTCPAPRPQVRGTGPGSGESGRHLKLKFATRKLKFAT